MKKLSSSEADSRLAGQNILRNFTKTEYSLPYTNKSIMYPYRVEDRYENKIKILVM